MVTAHPGSPRSRDSGLSSSVSSCKFDSLLARFDERTFDMKTTRAVSAALIGIFGWSITAAEPADVEPPWCTEISSADTSPLDRINLVSPGRIATGPALHLELIPGKACDPRKRPPGWCNPNAAAGTHGVLIHRYKSWACVVVPGKGKLATVAGWIPASRWVDDVSASTSTWIGVWQNNSAKLSITSADGLLHIVGNAIWQGISSPHFGSFTFDAPFGSDVVGQSGQSDECEVQIRKVGNFLFAQDNKKCGGMNVSFDGMYRYRGDLKR